MMYRHGGGFNGFGGSYHDPLSMGGRFGTGFGTFAAPTSMSGPDNQGGALLNLLRGGGNAVGRGMDWLTDKDQGENRINALFGLTNLVAGGVGAWKQGQREEREDKRLQQEREEDRRRRAAAGPAQGRILEMLMDAYGGG